ncbi:MAG: hypothetical protein OEV66_04845, partial [Spirochaetia bacterium]|nr:hypothetical protein [Spirochaetia bacterium]
TAFGADELAFLFVVSDVQVSDELQIKILKSFRQKCARCWIYRNLNTDQLCDRCIRVLQK